MHQRGNPPSWPATLGISLAHGVLLAAAVFFIDQPLRGLGTVDVAVLPLILLTIVAAFAGLLVCWPYRRVFAMAFALSPIAANLTLTPLAYSFGYSEPYLGHRGAMFLGLAIFAPFMALMNAVTGSITMHVLKRRRIAADMVHNRCMSCGYSLAGLRDPQCPECGAAINDPPSPTSSMP